MCGVPHEKVPGHPQEQLTQTLIVRLLNTHLFSSIQKLSGPVPFGPSLPALYGVDD